MSKFSERLSSLGQSAPARMGFGASASREKNPVMLLIGRTASTSNSEHVDLALLANGSESNGKDWGVEIGSGASLDADALQKRGCQFVLISSDEANAEILLSEEIGIGMPVTQGIEDSRIRAIEDGPFDFLLYQPDSIFWPLTVASVLDLQELVSSYSKHIFLELPAESAAPGEKDLEILKNLPVSALVVDLEKMSGSDIERIKESIDQLEPRKPSGKADRSPLVPMSGRNSSAETDAAGEGFDDDDWDD